MGWTASEIRRSSWWHFQACLDGFLRANGAEDKPEPMSLKQLDEMLARNGR